MLKRLLKQDKTRNRTVYPFAAIVGQQEMKRAIIATAIDPRIGGVVVFGDRGTGKSTTVRALANLLPPIEVNTNCAYNCDPAQSENFCDHCSERMQQASLESKLVTVPVVDLPLGATEDRIVGALDLERALTVGEKRFEPGLLAQAHRGFLYIDEVNLLEDHLVDLLLDVATTGENIVEREGLSVRHPAKFVLIGSGNPEEGQLRPQLLDRFGLCVDVTTPPDVQERMEIVRRRDEFDRDPIKFEEKWAVENADLCAQIKQAQSHLDAVKLSDEMLELVVRLCDAVGTEGSRGELTLIRTARALAAFDDADEIGKVHLSTIAGPALRHRLRSGPIEEAGSMARIGRAVEEILGA